MSPVRATARGAARTSLDGQRADVLICGASFAGLATALALRGTGADVLLVDRYEVGERQTSACACPMPWLEALGLEHTVRAGLPAMTFSTPHGTARMELGWAWGAFDYRELCRDLLARSGARFATAKVHRRVDDGVRTDRGVLRAPVLVDALGWRRVLDRTTTTQPPTALASRGLEVHPDDDPATAADALDVWIERSTIRHGYGWRVPAGGEARIGVGSYEPRDHVKAPTVALSERLGRPAVRFQGNWFPHRLRPAAADGAFFVGDSAGHCLPLSGEGIRPALHFGLVAGAEIARHLRGEQPLDQALRRYAAASAAQARFYGFAKRMQDVVPRLPPRALQAAFDAMAAPALSRRAFGWYLDRLPAPTPLVAPTAERALLAA